MALKLLSSRFKIRMNRHEEVAKLQDEVMEEEISNLPLDLVTEILVRLPPKSILKYKSVSKTWYSLIKSRPFIDFHTNHHRHDPKNRHLISHYNRFSRFWSWGQRLLHWVKSDEIPHVDMLGPLDTGIYLSVFCQPNPRNPITTQMYLRLINPSIMEFRDLEPIPFGGLSGSTGMRINYGFGYIRNSSVVEYKVVIVFDFGKDDDKNFYLLYNLKHGNNSYVKYSKPGLEIIQDVGMYLNGFFNGCWHWMGMQEDDDRDCVMFFDMANEVFGVIRGLPSLKPIEFRRGVFVLNDHIAAMYMTTILPDSDFISVEIWMMREYGVEDSWGKIYSAQAELTLYRELNIVVDVCFSMNEGLQRILFEGDDGNLLSFDGFQFKKHNLSGADFVTISPYIETLEPLSTEFDEDKLD